MNYLIQCGDHKWAPWSIVCRHLIDGMKEWNRVETDEGTDWFATNA